MAKGQPLPPGSPLQLRGLQRAGHSSNWAIARSLRATSPGRGQKGTPLTIRRNQWFRRWGNCEFEKEVTLDDLTRPVDLLRRVKPRCGINPDSYS
jgi:hypothetical protein